VCVCVCVCVCVPGPCRYVTTLRLVRVTVDQKGLYQVRVDNGDDSQEVTFDLEVQGGGPVNQKVSIIIM